MYRTVLVPTDGSEQSSAVIEEAVELARAFDATIHALYVVNVGAIPTTDVETRESLLAEIEERGREAVAEVEAMADEDVDVVTSVRSGVPSETIIEYADEGDVDVIVMGTHGRTGLRHALLGSVAERVIRNATVPVLVVRNRT